MTGILSYSSQCVQNTPYTAGDGELQGEYTELLNTDITEDIKSAAESTENSENSDAPETTASAEKISLQGQLQHAALQRAVSSCRIICPLSFRHLDCTLFI